jgi:cystathionine beta-lyase/cystathionine gamma-synthase
MAGTGTTCVHGGDARPEDGSVALPTPIWRTSTFRFKTTDDLRAAARGEGGGFYTRYGHPNFDAVERRFAALHGAEDAVLFASGMAALAAVVQEACRTGDRVVALRDLYGGTRNLLAWLADRAGVVTTWVPTQDPRAIERALPGARLLIAESPTNPMLKMIDVVRLAEACEREGVTLVFDDTFASPVNQRPIAFGADLVMESATKFLGGHSDLLGGIVAGSRERCEALRTVRKLTGAVADPETAWLLERGMKTLEARVLRQNATALDLARRLEAHPAVGRVLHPLLPSHPDHALARAQGLKGCALVTFACRGGLEAARRVADSVRLIANAPSLGGVESLLSLPLYTSHAMFTPAERADAGITDDLVRLSVGLESPDDLWSDLTQALA